MQVIQYSPLNDEMNDDNRKDYQDEEDIDNEDNDKEGEGQLTNGNNNDENNNDNNNEDEEDENKNEIKIIQREENNINENNKEEDIDLTEISNLSNQYVKVDIFKKVSDKVRILTSTINSKPSREEIETQLKKLNSRLENVEMITQGQTHGPRTRINLGLVNLPYNNTDSLNQTNSEEGSELNEVDYFAKIVEKKIKEKEECQ